MPLEKQLDHRPERETSSPEQSQSSLGGVIRLAVDHLFTHQTIRERLRGYEDDEILTKIVHNHKQDLVAHLGDTAEQALDDFLVQLDHLQAAPGIPLYPSLSAAGSQLPPFRTEAWDKPFVVTRICREDLRGMFADEEILRLTDGDMERIAEKLNETYRASEEYWERLEIMARVVLDKRTEESPKEE